MPEGSTAQSVTLAIPHREIHPSPLNIRKHFDPEGLKDLAASIKDSLFGVLEPIIVRPRDAGGYELLAGERRWRAVGLNIEAGDATPDYPIPAVVKNATDVQAVEMMLVENLQRKELTPMEEAAGYKILVDQGQKTKDIAKRTGISQRTIQQRLDLIERLHPTAQTALEGGLINVEQARILTRAPERTQEAALEEIKAGKVKTPEELQQVLFDLPQKDAAFFKLSEYTGEFAEDPDRKGVQLFADKAQFLKLQRAAIKAKAAELRKKFAFVEEVKWHDLSLPYTYDKAKKGDKDAGAVIVTGPGYKVEVHLNVVPKNKTPAAEPSKPAEKKAPEFSPEFLQEIADIKTAAVQAAILRNPDVALRIAFMFSQGLDGQVIDHPESMRAGECTTPANQDICRQRLKGIGAGLNAWQKISKLKAPQIAELIAASVAPLVSHAHIVADRPDDHPVFVAIAKAVKANVADVFEFYGDCGNEFVDRCGLPQLLRIAADLKLQETAPYRERRLEIEGGNDADAAAALRSTINVRMADHRRYMPPWLVIGSADEIAAHVKKTAAKLPKREQPASYDEIMKAHEKRQAKSFGPKKKAAAKPATKKTAKPKAKKSAKPKKGGK